MSQNLERALKLIEESFQLDDGDEQISVAENAVREADLSGHLETQYRAREQFVRACVFGGETDRALVAFAWLLAKFDQNPGRFSEWNILWKYKWILGLICEFPQISRVKIFEMLDDLAERSLRAGFGLRATYTHRYRIEKFWDNRTAAIENFRIMHELPIDDLANCPACEMDETVGFAIYCGMNEQAVALAQPILNGSQKCRTVPHRTYANLLLPMVQMGRQNEGLDFHRAGYRLISNNKDNLDKISDHLLFMALTENFAPGTRMFEKHFPWSEQNRNMADRFRFFRAAWFLFDVLAERGKETVELRLPDSFPEHSTENCYDPTQLANWFKRQAETLARLFDERNETDFFSRTLTETPALKRLCAPFPLGPID
jgi:hypothetical protein